MPCNYYKIFFKD